MIEDGEIFYCGFNVMKGYWKVFEVIVVVIEDGWLYIGDIGYIDEDGFFVIIDCFKDIIVIFNGKNILFQLIENLFMKDFFFEYVVLLGDNCLCLILFVKLLLFQVEELVERLYIILMMGLEMLCFEELVEEICCWVVEIIEKLFY